MFSDFRASYRIYRARELVFLWNQKGISMFLGNNLQIVFVVAPLTWEEYLSPWQREWEEFVHQRDNQIQAGGPRQTDTHGTGKDFPFIKCDLVNCSKTKRPVLLQDLVTPSWGNMLKFYNILFINKKTDTKDSRSIPHICHRHHRRCLWRTTLSCGEISDFFAWQLQSNVKFPHIWSNFKKFHMADVEKSEIFPHDRCL